MLVLTRKVGEAIVLDGRVRVTLTATTGGRVKIGVVAPADVPVHRGEVADRTAAGDLPGLPPAAPRPGRRSASA